MTGNLLKRIGRLRELRILLVIVAFGLAMWIYNADFLSFRVINLILLYLAGYAIMACGMTVLLVSGGFDLSVGSVSALSATVAAVLMTEQAVRLPWPVALTFGLLTGALIGLFNGVAVAKLKINPFITTLGTMLLARGLTYVVSGGMERSGLPEMFQWLGQHQVLRVIELEEIGGEVRKVGIQLPIVVSLTLVVAADFLLRKNRFFRQNYYIGGNEQAAWLSGIAVNKIKIFNYCLSGILAAIAGLLFAAQTGAAAPTDGEGDELKVITAVIVGGASLAGGKGTVFGAFLGCLLLAMIRPAIEFIGIQDDWEKVIVGGILLFAVMLDRWGKRD